MQDGTKPSLGSITSLDWTVLPPELQQLIFGAVPTILLGTLRLVCKRWRAASSNLRFFYAASQDIHADRLSGILSIFPYCFQLNLSRGTLLNAADLGCVSNLRALRSLSLPKNLTTEHLQRVASLTNVVNSLHSLTIDPVPHRPEISLLALTSFQNLQDISLGTASLDECLSAVSKLRYLTCLTLLQMVSKEKGVLAKYLSALGELRALTIEDLYLNLSAEDSDAICKLPSLRSLLIEQDDCDIYGEISVSRSSISPPTAEGSRALTSLHEMIVPPSFFTSHVLANVKSLHKLTRLRMLSPTGDPSFTIGDLRCLASKAPALRTLLIPWPPMSNELLEALSYFSLQRVHITRADACLDEGVALLTRMSSLRALIVSADALTDCALPHIARLSDITFLSMSRAPFTSRGLRHLSSLSSLKNLSLRHIPVTDEVLEAIVRSNTKLERLGVLSGQLSCGTYLSCLQSLKHLDVSDNRSVGDSTVRWLCSSLDSLNIAKTNVTGVGFKDVAYVNSLHSLTLVSAVEPAPSIPLTLEGAQHIARLTNVKALHLASARINEDILRALLSNNRYMSIAVFGLPASLVPLILQCTMLRSLRLSDPRGVTDTMIQNMHKSLPSLVTFDVREAGQERWRKKLCA